MKTEEQIQTEFKERVQNRRDGFEATQERVRDEICAARRRERLVLIPLPLRAAAALLILGLGIPFALSLKSNALPLCPHSANVNPPEELSPYIADEECDIFHPERYDRLCYCAPRYSGSLR